MANKFDHLTATERVGAPSTPTTGDWAVYFKSDGFYVIDDAGTESGPLSAGDLAAHLADATDAHDASAISFVPAGTIAATTVQAAIEEVATEAGSGSVSDAAYGVGWDGDTTTAASKNAIYDKIETLGGGSSSLIDKPAPIVRTAGDLVIASNSNVWAEVSSALRFVMSGAAVGDIVRYGLGGMMSGGSIADHSLMPATMNTTSHAIVNQFAAGTRTPLLGYAPGSTIVHAGGVAEYVLQAGDIFTGDVEVSLTCSVGSQMTLYANTNYGLQVWAELVRPPA